MVPCRCGGTYCSGDLALSGIVRVVVDTDLARHLDTLVRVFRHDRRKVFVPCAGDMETILAECERIAPCVLLLASQKLDSAERVEGIKWRICFGEKVRLIIVGPSRGNEFVERLLRVGCMGFLEVDVEPQAVADAVRAVAQGEIWAPRCALSHLLRKSLCRMEARHLTARETHVLSLIGRGFKNFVIAEKLSISRDTVRWHIRGIYSKIGLRDRKSAAAYARALLGVDNDSKVPGFEQAELGDYAHVDRDSLAS